jgi:hypothetical protein
MAEFDVSAPRKKYALVKKIRAWNEAHPNKRVEYYRAPGETVTRFDPKSKAIGNPARETLKNMQRAAGKAPSGQFNLETMKWLLPVGIRGEVMALAHSQLGMHEWPDGSNMGEIVKYLNAVGLGGGYPWCAAFVTWCLKKLGFQHFPANPAYVPSYYGWAKEKGILRPVDESELGDLWIWWKLQHIGFCDDTDPDDKIAYGLDGNVGLHGGTVTEVRRTAQEVTACINLEKMFALR